MSNEELAVAVQSGATERMEELWERVKGFIAWKARQLMQEHPFSTAVDLEDLVQSGYIALVAAVRSYKPESGAFLTWLGSALKIFSLKQRATGRPSRRTTRQGTL